MYPCVYVSMSGRGLQLVSLINVVDLSRVEIA